MKSFDVIIIGGGIVGCLTARYLSRYQLKIRLLEKDSDIGMGPSAANSACIHAGHDPVPGTLKAQMNHIANPLWSGLSAELSIPFKRTGAYVVALQGDEPDCLDLLKQQGDANGYPARSSVPRRCRQLSRGLIHWSGGLCAYQPLAPSTHSLPM